MTEQEHIFSPQSVNHQSAAEILNLKSSCYYQDDADRLVYEPHDAEEPSTPIGRYYCRNQGKP